MSKRVAIKPIKDLGWDHIALTTKAFNGAVQEYVSENNTKVAVCFNMHQAFVVEDEIGLFETEDLVSGIIKSKDFDVEAVHNIEGSVIVAYETEEGVDFNEEKLTQLGINSYEVKESMKTRIKMLSELDTYVDAPM